ncbi:MAG: hypothetical protein Q4G34_01270 [Micrococcus sp.]|nr:hypothetical protein [Micrococcus sp.]
MNESSTSSDPLSLSRAEGEYLDRVFPDIARSMGALSVTRLHERTCSTTAISGPSAARHTAWVADAEVAVANEDVAIKVAKNVREQAEHYGWTTAENPRDVGADGNYAGQRLLGATLEDPNLVMIVLLDKKYDGTPIVATVIHGRCYDMPEGHRMTRSTLDPDYGSASSAYVETDSLDDYTGRPAPLPSSTQTPAPTGPEGATPLYVPEDPRR